MSMPRPLPMRRFLPVLASLLLVSCATQPVVDRSAVTSDITPARAARDNAAAGATVNWGGLIVDTTNTESSTEIEILSLPLDAKGRPSRDGEAGGRFIAVAPGFLEPTNYRAGVLVSAVGDIEGLRQGRIGQADYTYPVLRVRQIRVVEEQGRRVFPYFSIGVGIGL
jgi:outer membrane lipoprotein